MTENLYQDWYPIHSSFTKAQLPCGCKFESAAHLGSNDEVDFHSCGTCGEEFVTLR